MVYLSHSQESHGERQVPCRVLAGWACRQWVLLATSLLCRAWKALGAVLLGITADGAGLAEEVSAATLSLRNKRRERLQLTINVTGQGKMVWTTGCHWPNATQKDFWKCMAGS